MWAYVVTRRTYFGVSVKTVRKNWQPVIGQDTVDFDNLPGGSIGLPVSAPPVPVTSVAGETGAVGAESLAGALAEFMPIPDVSGKLDASVVGAADGVAPLGVDQKVPDASLPTRLGTTALNATFDRAFEPSTSIVYDAATGNVTSATEGGITTTFTYNTDGSVKTETRLGKVRTWVYDAAGNPTSSTVV
jgi:YD repeat-containing protein